MAATKHENLTAALAAFHTDLPKVGKNKINPHFKSKYAGLDDIAEAVLPALGKHGLAFVAAPTLTEHGFALVCTLKHETGGQVAGSWPLPSGGKPQDLGSALTYARRYMLTALTGVAPDEDDDGNGAQNTTRETPVRRAAAKPAERPAPPENWRDKVAAAQTVDELGTMFQSAQAAGWLTDEIVAALNARKAEVSA